MKKVNKKIDEDLLDKDIQDAITRQYRESWNDLQTTRENARNRKKQQEKEEKFLSVLVVIFIIIVVIMTIILGCKMTEKARKNCIAMGHSEDYCYEKL